MSGVFTNRARLAPKLIEARARERRARLEFSASSPTTTRSWRARWPTSCSARLDGKGDHILAARFLSRFVPADTPWAHVDLSAATRSGGLAHVATDVTGFGVRFALELLLGQKALGAPGSRA